MIFDTPIKFHTDHRGWIDCELRELDGGRLAFRFLRGTGITNRISPFLSDQRGDRFSILRSRDQEIAGVGPGSVRNAAQTRSVHLPTSGEARLRK